MDEEGNYVATHFAQNLSPIEHLLKYWAKYKKEADDQALLNIEAGLDEIRNYEGGGFLSQNDKENLMSL